MPFFFLSPLKFIMSFVNHKQKFVYVSYKGIPKKCKTYSCRKMFLRLESNFLELKVWFSNVETISCMLRHSVIFANSSITILEIFI